MDLDQIRAAMQAELKDVIAKSERLEAHLRNQDRTLPNDWSEMAQFIENDEVLEALEERSRERIDSILRAMDRITAGTYEQCSNCGKTIGAARLELLPTTAVCAACAR
ncbi:MAG: TraR/DksA family transcriptional regulator [Longimicrobiales bacterium]